MEKHQHDQWLINGSPDFGWVPGGLIPGCPDAAPIWMFRGTRAWGWEHIAHKHGAWVRKYHDSVEELLWSKCSEPGLIHATASGSKLSVALTIAPTAFLVLTYQPWATCFSVTTVYNRWQGTQFPIVGRYDGRDDDDRKRPVYAWLPYREIDRPPPDDARRPIAVDQSSADWNK